jgi:hypothetical protein
VPRRTVSVVNFHVHTAHKPNERKVANNFDGKGADLLHLLRGFIAAIDPNALVDDEQERYVSITELDPQGRTLFVEVEAGWFGTEGKVKNVRTHKTRLEHDSEDATVRRIRFVAVAPIGSLGMLVFVERVGGVSAASKILALFQQSLRAKYEGEKLTFKNEAMVEKAAWLKKAKLERVKGQVTSYSHSADTADGGSTKIVGALNIDLVPEGGKQFLPKKIWEGLKKRDLDAAQVLGLNADADVDKLSVTVSADGKSKTFAIDREKEPSLAYLLAEKGEPDSDAFLDFSFDHAKDLLPAVGVEWDNGVKAGAWSAKELAVTLEMPGE